MSWLDLLVEAQARGEPSVLVTVAVVKGSAPREPGATLLVTPERVLGTVGGGRLEYLAIEKGRQLLRQDCPEAQCLLRYDLVPDRRGSGMEAKIGEIAVQSSTQPPSGQRLDQCCGGVVQLHYQYVAAQPAPWIELATDCASAFEPAVLVSYLDQALPTMTQLLRQKDLQAPIRQVSILQPLRRHLHALLLDCQRDVPLLFDSAGNAWQSEHQRASVLLRPLAVDDFVPVVFGAGHVGKALVGMLARLASRVLWWDCREGQFPQHNPRNVEVTLESPEELIERAPSNACFLVMTHSHPLDLSLCAAILQRGRFNYFGLIGSRAKRVRFDQRLREQGVTKEQLARMYSPIGIEGIDGKQPEVIAVSVAAQLLQLKSQGWQARQQGGASQPDNKRRFL